MGRGRAVPFRSFPPPLGYPQLPFSLSSPLLSPFISPLFSSVSHAVASRFLGRWRSARSHGALGTRLSCRVPKPVAGSFQLALACACGLP